MSDVFKAETGPAPAEFPVAADIHAQLDKLVEVGTPITARAFPHLSQEKVQMVAALSAVATMLIQGAPIDTELSVSLTPSAAQPPAIDPFSFLGF